MSKTSGGRPEKAQPKRKTAKKRGRQTTYTKAKADEIVDRLAGGDSLSKICRSRHLPPASTVIGWVMDDRHGFAERYARAREIQCDLMFDQLDELSRKALNVAKGAPGTGEAGARVQAIKLEIDTLKWILAKRFPERWAERVKNEHTGKDGGPIKQESEFTVTPEDEAVIARIREKREEIAQDGKE